MKHIIFLDSLSKLSIEKDSSILLALSLKARGFTTYLLFEENFSFVTTDKISLVMYEFQGVVDSTFYIKDFKVLSKREIYLEKDDILHMRIDPPFDERYLRMLWMLDLLKNIIGVKIVNNAVGILKYNEKLSAFTYKDYSIPSFVGVSYDRFSYFCQKLISEGIDDLILKPLNLYQGIGVEKHSLKKLFSKEKFQQLIVGYNGPLIAQPFIESVSRGEIRTVFFKGVEIGTIKKIPPAGGFLANIASGASYQKDKLTTHQKMMADKICKDMKDDGIDLIAFDFLDTYCSEINITCPGLMVEISSAYELNITMKIIDNLCS